MAIPKTIHYCWFGGNLLPKDAIKCIESWRKYMPDYEIKRWDETNFDVNSIPYTSQAYAAGKYAFVSDYARFKILYDHGGIYFDTDVELLKSMEHILSSGAYMGFEHSDDDTPCWVNPGLGMASEVHSNFVGRMLKLYESYDSFNFGTHTVVTNTTSLLREFGLRNENSKQIVAGINIYPSSYFCPIDSKTGIKRISAETVSIHHYSCSWIAQNTLSWKLHLLKNFTYRALGESLAKKIYGLLRK